MTLSDRPQFFPSRDLHILRGDLAAVLWKLLQVSFSTGPDNTTTCGTLHPAGSCFMRTGVDGITLFCAACRFALVDRIDPEQHWRNDREYERE